MNEMCVYGVAYEWDINKRTTSDMLKTTGVGSEGNRVGFEWKSSGFGLKFIHFNEVM